MDAAAEALGMMPEELSAEFRAGKTLAQLTVEKDINPMIVQQAIQAATKAEPMAAIHQAVSDRLMTQDNTDWSLQGLEKDYWGAGKIFAASSRLNACVPRATSQRQLHNFPLTCQ